MDIKTLVVGDIVEHKLSKDWLMVLEIGEYRVVCRTKSLDTKEFFDFELQPQTKR